MLCVSKSLFAITTATIVAFSSTYSAEAREPFADVAAVSSLRPGGFQWNRQESSEGPIEIVVSLPQQRAYVFRGDTLIGVSTVSSERGRAVKLSLTNGRLMLSVTNPDSGSATEEIEVEYGSEPLDIGFNSRYLLDIAAQLEGEAAVLKLADPGSPTLIQDRDTKGALYVLMPMRV